MRRKRSPFPLDLKTGRLIFTPVLRSTGERLKLEVDVTSFPGSKAEGFHGHTQDLKSGRWYAVYGKECDIPGCHCDAWVEELPGPPAEVVGRGSIGVMRDDAELLDQIVADAMMRRQLRGWLPSREDFTAVEAIAAATDRTLPEVLNEAIYLLRVQWEQDEALADAQ